MLYLTTNGLEIPVVMDTTGCWVRCQRGCGALQTNLFDKEYSAAIVDDSLYVRKDIISSGRDA
jgi:hypothetical protein